MHIIFAIDTLKRGGKERRLIQLINNLPVHINYSVLLLKNEIEFDIAGFSKSILIYDGKENKINKLIWFSRNIKKINPDLVHSWYSECSQFSIPICKLLSIKFITSEITNIYPLSHNRLSKFQIIKSFIFRLADHITSNSKAGLEIYKAPKNKSSIIYNGFDFKRLESLSEEFDMPDYSDKIVILMVANFTDKKDYQTFINAAVNLLNKRGGLVFIGLGKGPNLDKIRKLIPAHLKPSIIIPGFTLNVEDYIKLSDIGVLTSFGEGFPNSLMEFMAFRKPVIATSGGGTNELITNNFNGLLIPQKNISALEAAIEDLIDKKEKRYALGQNGFDNLKANFSVEKMTKEFLDLYRKV